MTELVEQWRPIEGYDGLYEVSNIGRVRSIGYGKERILSHKINHNGYLEVCLYNGGKGKMFQVHRLVGQAFIPNPEEFPVINHRDEDKTNNRVDNLEWCTYEYNSNYGTCKERIVQTMISKGIADPEMCGIKTKDKKEYDRLYYQKNKDRFRERRTEYMREYRRRKKQKQTT